MYYLFLYFALCGNSLKIDNLELLDPSSVELWDSVDSTLLFVVL